MNLQATGLTGLAVSTNPHHTLGVLYNKILRVVQKMPENAAYRKHTEVLITERNKIVLAVSTGYTELQVRAPIHKTHSNFRRLALRISKRKLDVVK